MNALGEDYVKKASKLISEYNKTNKEKYKGYQWEDAMFQERFMRMGVEFRAFEITEYDLDDAISVTLASLQYSFLKHKVP